MGRKHAPEPRSKVLSQRYTAAEAAAIARMSAEAGMSSNDWVRMRAIPRVAGGPPVRGMVVSRGPAYRLPPPVWHELRKQAVNAGQILAQLATHKLTAPAELMQLRAGLQRLIQPLAPATPGTTLAVPTTTRAELERLGGLLNQSAHQINAQNLGPVPELAGLAAQLLDQLAPLVAADEAARAAPFDPEAGATDGA